MASNSIEIFICDARNGEPVLQSFQLKLADGQSATVGHALLQQYYHLVLAEPQFQNPVQPLIHFQILVAEIYLGYQQLMQM